MFWDIFYNLCIEKNKKPNTICKELGLSSATATHWKNGSVPNGDVLSKLADYFGVSVDYLLGKTDKKNKTDSGDRSLTDAEKEIIAATADMTEDELNAVLGYAARIIAKRKKED